MWRKNEKLSVLIEIFLRVRSGGGGKGIGPPLCLREEAEGRGCHGGMRAALESFPKVRAMTRNLGWKMNDAQQRDFIDIESCYPSGVSKFLRTIASQ